MVIVKSTALGHQQVVISAESDGVIDFELYHADVDKLIDVLGVSDNIVKHYAKQDVKDAKKAEEMQQKQMEEMKEKQAEMMDGTTMPEAATTNGVTQ